MPPIYHPRPERWPQVSLRGLLIVTALVALLMPKLAAEYRGWKRGRLLDKLTSRQDRERKRLDALKPRRLSPQAEMDEAIREITKSHAKRP